MLNEVKILNEGAMVLKETDTSEVFEFQLIEDGAPRDLTGATVMVVIKNGKDIVYNREINIADAENGIVNFNLTDSDYLGTGYLLLEFIVNHADGIREIFPQKGAVGLRMESRLKGDIVDLDPVNSIVRLEYLEEEMVGILERLENIEQNGVTGGGSGGGDLSNYVTNDKLAEELATKADALHSHTEYPTEVRVEELIAQAQLSGSVQNPIWVGTNVEYATAYNNGELHIGQIIIITDDDDIITDETTSQLGKAILGKMILQ